MLLVDMKELVLWFESLAEEPPTLTLLLSQVDCRGNGANHADSWPGVLSDHLADGCQHRG